MVVREDVGGPISCYQTIYTSVKNVVSGANWATKREEALHKPNDNPIRFTRVATTAAAVAAANSNRQEDRIVNRTE